MPRAHPLVIGFAAYSGTGKTQLLTQLIPQFHRHGLRVGVIKASHHDVSIDQPGKDSSRLRAAGATPVMLSSPYRRALISEWPSPQPVQLADELAAFPQQSVDLILVEGFKHEPFAKIELHRPSLGKPLLYPADPSIIAVASDTPLNLPNHLAALDLNHPAIIVSFILTYREHTLL